MKKMELARNCFTCLPEEASREGDARIEKRGKRKKDAGA